MTYFTNKTILITGAASGLGKGFAFKALDYQMRIILLDIEETPLIETYTELIQKGAEVHYYLVDITKLEQVKIVTQDIIKQFHTIDFLFNNAGVAGPMGTVWSLSYESFSWVMNVNYFGTLNLIQAFLPFWVDSGTNAHIVNVASMAGLYTAPYLSAYQAAKHAVVSLTESLYFDIKQRGLPINVSLVCPGWVKTNILNDIRNDPYQVQVNFDHYTEKDANWILNFARKIKKGTSPEEIAERVFLGVENKKFYIFTHTEMKQLFVTRLTQMINDENPIPANFD